MDEYVAPPIWLTEEPVRGAQEPGRALRCLLVEDSRFDRSLLRYSAERAGVEVHFVDASTMAEARRNLKTKDFDLIILDKGMPDGNGFELAHELTAGTRNAGIPAIAMSGGDAVDIKEEARLAGCAEFLAKHDLSPEELARVIGQVMRSRKTEAQAASADMSIELDLLMSSFGDTARMVRQKPMISRLVALVGELRGQDDGRHAAVLEEMADICMMLWIEIEGQGATPEMDPALDRIA